MSVEQSKISLGSLQVDELESINKLLEQNESCESKISDKQTKVKKTITITLVAVVSFIVIILTNFSIDVYLTYSNIASSSTLLAFIYLGIYFIAIIGLFLYILHIFKNYSNLKDAFTIQNRTASCNGYEEEKEVALLILAHYQQHQNIDIVQKANILKEKLESNSFHSPFEEIKSNLIDDLDKEAISTTYKSSQEVSVFTAFSSSSALDSIIVIFSSLKLMKKIFLIYGYKTNIFTSLLIYRKILENASLSALMEYTDDSVSDILGNSLFSTVSVKIAQGIGNGVLLLRIGNMLIQSARPFASDGTIGSYKQMVQIFFQFVKNKVVK